MRCLLVPVLGALLALNNDNGAFAFLISVPAPSSARLASRAATSLLPSTSIYHAFYQRYISFNSLLAAASDGAGASMNDDDDEEAIPGKMKVGEIKAELDLRGVTYAGVFERSDLETLLLKARMEGKARPEILDTFNQQREDEEKRAGRATPDFDWDAAKAGDGNLPGGVDPEALQKLTSSQEMMEIMSNPRLQELMKAVMSKDNETMQKYMADAEILQLMARFQKLSQEAGIDPSMFPPPPGME